MAWLKRILIFFKNKFNQFESYLFQESDSTSLALFRILFGLLMALDVPQERGLEDADIKFNDPKYCFFQLFDFIQPVPLQYTCIIYSIMWIGSLGIMLGYYFRISCTMYLIPYIYFYLLDKSRWNNHSYLFALTVILICASDAGDFYSIDNYFHRSKEESTKLTTVPRWNYFMLKFQIFILYFYAALKKIDADWLAGYSMRNISKHQLFGPISSIFDDKVIDYYMIHVGGFLFDLSIGFLLNIQSTKKVAFLLSIMFHGLNSQLFDIGMFPYVCLSSLILFCEPYEFPCSYFTGSINPNIVLNKPKQRKHKKPNKLASTKQKASTKSVLVSTTAATTSKLKNIQKSTSSRSWKLALIILYMSIQIILPFTHSITKGYNNWTNGLYGYSWDMMVYSWNTLHTKITVKNSVTGELRFLDPNVWTTNDRWSSHADMAKQYARCIKRNLAQFNQSNIEIYFDVWKSLNGRFQQRIFDPRVDILKAPWSPWENVSWVLPLLTEFSHWRRQMFEQISSQVSNWTKSSNVIFVADYPGLILENYLPDQLVNISLIIMKGKITCEQVGQPNITLEAEMDNLEIDSIFNRRVEIQSGEFHKIHTISNTPSCYMYTYTNSTADRIETTRPSTAVQEAPICAKIIKSFQTFISDKIEIFSRSFYLILNAYLNVLFDVPMVVRKPID